jgi:hypothetical protein
MPRPLLTRPRACLFALLAGCGGPDETRLAAWSVVAKSVDSALLSVSGTSSDDVWLVGADGGAGPLVLHWDGSSWDSRQSGVRGDMWWVHAMPSGSVYLAGSDSHVLRYRDGGFERLATPGLGKHIVFGVWGPADDDVYAVGSAQGRNGFVWHYDGQTWTELGLPLDLPQDENRDVPGFFKVWGTSPEDVWVVGDRGVVLQGNAADGFRLVPSGSDERLFTVHAADGELAIVGGSANGSAFEARGGELDDITPPGSGLLQGVCVSDSGSVWAVGVGGAVYRRPAKGADWQALDPRVPVQSLHAVWVDPAGGAWTVGGNVLTNDLDGGVALHYPSSASESVVPSFERPPVPPVTPVCPGSAIDPAPSSSIARRWDEQALGAIRRDLPRPTVHARNLFHLSVGLWDSWAAYDSVASGYLVRERHAAPDAAAAREEALSYAAYRVLSHAYRGAVGGPVSQACFDAFMAKLGYDPNDSTSLGDSPRAFGNRVAEAVIGEFADDGANEGADYADTTGFVSDNPRLVVDLPGTVVSDPLHWQQLELSEAVTQNGIALGTSPGYVGPQWGQVTPFALSRPAPGAPYLDIGRAPTSLDGELVDALVEVIRRGSELDPSDGVREDYSPGAYGNNSLGTNDGQGRAVNPVTGQPYPSRPTLRGDFGRVLAEFWADGPQSETPPGHWNSIANGVADDPRFARRLFGTTALPALDWDVHLYLALNGALHDAAIAAWELKRLYTSARPITLVRYMGQLGQRSDAGAGSFHPDGLPLVPGLIELVTEASSAPGERHAALARYVGAVALRAWRGEPGYRDSDVAGVGWILARDWLPYQRRTFVTPAFPGYVSGHSTFSRAAAAVLHQLTGSEFFPGGLGQARFEPGTLFFERGPTEPVELQWASYYDAADQAGQSRIWGGIHLSLDDLDGRRIGERVGRAAVARATPYFMGNSPP